MRLSLPRSFFWGLQYFLLTILVVIHYTISWVNSITKFCNFLGEFKVKITKLVNSNSQFSYHAGSFHRNHTGMFGSKLAVIAKKPLPIPISTWVHIGTLERCKFNSDQFRKPSKVSFTVPTEKGTFLYSSKVPRSVGTRFPSSQERFRAT